MLRSDTVFPYHSTLVSMWRGLIDSAGTDQFRDRLMQTLEMCAGVAHYAAFRLAPDQVRLVATDGALAGEWLAAPLVAMANALAPRSAVVQHVERDGKTVLQRIEPAQLCLFGAGPNGQLQKLVDGVFVSSERSGQVFAFALMRTAHEGCFTEDELENIHSVTGTCLSILAKHENILRNARRGDSSQALLGSVDQIESTLKTQIPALTKRETQVCARILRGISTPGIAIDLGVREDSVATYRKRAYQRLSIGSRFELIQLFVGTAALGA
jgi:DNA-binding CsgD family transcriptional regulator